MFVKAGNNEYELKTTLGVAKKLEDRSKKTLNDIMAELSRSATVDDMITTLSTALADSSRAKEFAEDILDNMDVVTIRNTCDELLLRICFGGTPEEQEAKISDFPASARHKNIMRRALGLPIAEETPSTSGGSSEQATE